ncbi:MAG: carboxyl transferase domain-containing protein [Acidimicrobiales bacterium]
MRTSTTHFGESGRMFYEITEKHPSCASPPCRWCSAGSTPVAPPPARDGLQHLDPGSVKVFLGGPPLVKMATGEESDDETLGGAVMHTEISGLGDHLANDEADAIRLCRESSPT